MIHYSIHKTRTASGETVLIRLSAINCITQVGHHYSVVLDCCHEIDLNEYDGQALIRAWNSYQAIQGALPFVEPQTSQSQYSVLAAIRGDEYLADVVERQQQKLEELESA